MRRFRLRLILAVTVILAVGLAAVFASMGRSFAFVAPGYAQHLYGVSSLRSSSFSLGGVVVLQDGTVVSAECRGPQTKLHIFDPSPSATFTKNDTLLHKETPANGSANLTGGCGLAFENVGGTNYIFSNLNDTSSSDGDGTFGIARIQWPSLNVTKFAPGSPGNGLGIAVDPQSGDLIYAGNACRLTNPLPVTCPLYRFNPSTLAVTTFASLPGSQFAFIDGIAFEPTHGDYLFITNRTTLRGELDVVNRSGQVVSRTPLLDATTTGTDPVGIGFHGSPSFIVTSNQDGTMTEYDYPGGYEVPAAPRLFASGGSRGDMIQAGPDGCLYVTQLQTVYNDPSKTDNFNSIAQICSGFVPPPGITPWPPPSPSSLCGFVYNDANNNGGKETGEAGIGGVTVNLSGSDYLDFPVTASTTTSPTDGSYCFNDLKAGTYTISEVQPPAYLDGIDTQGAPGNGTAGSDSFNDVALAAGYNGNNNNFGELKHSSLSGYVYVDKDNDGKFDGSEQAIAAVTITLTGTDDRGKAVNMTGATGTDGAYSFMQLRPGTYTITETQPAGYLDGKDTQGTPGGAAGDDVFSNIVLAQNVNGLNNNFGEIQPVPAITLVKKTNGKDNTVAPGLYVPAGSAVTWTYIVTNTGNELLSSIAVTDDKVGAITCPAVTLDINASMTCTATGTAVVGQYTNVGTVTGRDAFGTVVTATNAENYFGAMPGIAVTKQTNGTDNDAAPGPTIAAGSAVTWTYFVTNTGNVTLSNVSVKDDKAGAVSCPSKTLTPTTSMTCTKTGTAVTGQYTNIGTATGTDPTAAVVTASNPDNYFGATPTLTIATKTNGTDNNSPTGPVLRVGAPVTWTYTVSNTGNVPFTRVVVTDSRIGAVTCPASTLDIGESFTCTMAGTAVAGQYTNVGTATGTSVGGTTTASNPDNYFGATPAISIVTKTNNVDNDSGAGLIVAAASTVTWSYTVTNRGNIALSSIAVIDDKAGPITCPGTTLGVGASVTCTTTGTAVAGPYTNTGTVTAADVTGAVVSASNQDGYFGSRPSVAIVTRTNGTNNDAPPGPSLAAGNPVTWTYLLSNTGNIALANVLVSDNKGGGVSCPATSIAPGATMTCTRTGTAAAGPYTNVGTVTAKDPIGTAVTASNPDNYFGVSSAISIVARTNGTDNDAGTGPVLTFGSTVTWTYTVTNIGNAALSNAVITDDKAGAVCTVATLAAGASATCTKTGTAAAGQYTNVASVTAQDILGASVSAQNVDHYFGAVPPAPVAMPDSASTLEGTPVTIAVLANDTSLSGTPLVVAGIPSAPAHGTAAPTAARTAIVYTPMTGFVGQDVFSYSVTDAAGGVAAATVTVDVTGVGRFVVLATDFMFIGDRSIVGSGDLGANQELRLPFVKDAVNDHDLDNLTVWIDEDVKMQSAQSRVVGDTVRLDAGSSVANVITNGILAGSNGLIRGTTTMSMRIPYVSMPGLRTTTPGTTNVVLNGGTRTLNAGSYGTIQVTRGGTLVLTGGLYQLSVLDLELGSTVIFKAPTELRVDKQVDADAKVRLILDPAVSGLKASDVMIYVDPPDPAKKGFHSCASAWLSLVQFGPESVIQANIYAPDRTIWMGNKTVATGAFIAEHVIIGDDTKLTLESAFK